MLGTVGIVRLGAQWNQVDASVDVGDPVLPTVRQLSAGVAASIVIDQVDQAWFA